MSTIQIVKRIDGPQSSVYFVSDGTSVYVEKIATQSGEQDLLDQIEFYLNLPSSVKLFFPQMLDYKINERPYKMTMEMSNLPTLKSILLYDEMNEFLSKQLTNVMYNICTQIHTLEKAYVNIDYVIKHYKVRCYQRVKQTQNMLTSNYKWLFNKIILNGEEIDNPIISLFNIIDDIANSLIPDFVCTTHGQLGPSHMLLSKNEYGEFKLLDPKGFKSLHDPILDFAKLGRTFLYGMEWLEDDLFSLEYSIINDQLIIEFFNIKGFNKNALTSLFENLFLENDIVQSFKNAKLRFYALIYSDIIASLPFGCKSGGERRIIALLIIASYCYRNLRDYLE